MENKKIELEEEVLANISGGSLALSNDGNGGFNGVCQYSGYTFHCSMASVGKICAFGATVTDTPEGEQALIKYCVENHLFD